MHKIIGYITAGFLSVHAYAFNASLHMSQPQERVQTQSGGEATDPISPGIAIGHSFQILQNYYFAPQLGYIVNEVKSADHYSGKYKVETIYLHYDFVRPLNQSRTFRAHFGFANLIKKISGKGGEVTIPNGTGTGTAYRPSSSHSSYTHAFTVGSEQELYHTKNGGIISAYDLFGNFFIMEPLDDRRRLILVQIGISARF